jgi:hypothetical protein
MITEECDAGDLEESDRGFRRSLLFLAYFSQSQSYLTGG